NPTSVIDPIANQTICSQSAFQDVFVTSPTQPTASITYTWEVTSAGPNLSGYTVSSGPIAITNPILGETIFNASNTAEDLIYTLTPYYDNCEGTAQTFTITVDPTPEIPDVNTSICSEETFDVLPENGLPTPATIIPVNTTYTWTVLPNPNVTGQSDEIQPQNNISQTLINLTNVAQDVVYIVTPTSADGCEGATFELTVTVETRPIIEDKIAGACSGDAFLVEPTDNSPLEIVPSNTLYTWTILPGADLVDLTGYSDQTTGMSSISQTLVNLTDESKTIVYEVIPISGTCEGLPFEIEVTVSPSPFVDDIIVTPICSEDTFTVIPETAVPSPNNIVPIGTTFTWTVVDNPNVIGDTNEVNPQSQISQTLINTSSTTQTVVYTVVPSSSGCDGPSFTITVDVKPRPFIVSGPDTQDTQCSGDPFVILPQDGVPTSATIVPVGTQYTWTTLGNPDLLGWSNQTVPVDLITQTLENTTNQIQQIIYTIIPEADGCVGPSFDAVITIEPKPFVPDVIVDICDATSSSNSSYILSPQNGVLPDASTIIPDITTYTWGPPIVTGGLTGGSTGNDEAFFDSGNFENPTTNLQTAIYTVTPNYYTMSNPTTPQCSGEPFTITITVSPSPEINEVITNIACSYSDPLCGASIEISPVGIGPFTYSWVSIEGNPLNDPTDEDQFDLCPGTYELTITDASSCSYVFEYEIVPPEPVEFTLITQTDISCNNVNTLPCDGSIEVSAVGGTLPYNLVEWYTETIPGSGVFDSGPLINIINPYNLVNACEGNYVLKILDANGCEFVSDVYTIEQAVEPIILTETLSNYNGFNIDCNAANSGTITVDLSGGSGVFIYSFVDATGAVLEADTILSSPATLVFDFLIAGDYTLTFEDPNCTDQIVRNYTLTQPDELIITATLVDPVSCFGGLATYNVTATGGVPPYTGTGLQSVLSGPVTFIVSDANGCEDDFSTVVTEPAELLATYVVDDAPCFGDTGQITVTPTGGTGVLTVNLYDNNTIFITSLNTTQGNSVIFDQLAATYFYDVVDQNNCSYGPEVVVIDEPDPIVIIDFEVVQPDCNTVPAWEFNNGSICITITGGTNPFPIGTGWVDNGGGQWCLNNLSAGTYAIDVTDSNNCSLQNPFPDITLVRPPEITAVLTNTIDIDCDTDTATQINTIIVNGGVPPYQVTWSGGIVDAANPFVMETSVPGNYSAFVNDQYGLINGCPPIEFPLDPITFFEFGIADFTLSSDNSDFCGIYAIDDPIQFNNISTGDIVSYTWNFGDGSPEFNGPNAPDHIYNAIGTYTISLTVEDLYGCFDTYSETIAITKGYEIILPNAFTPNGDGINETIRPVTICMTEIKLSIYDTWGSLIYSETSDDIYGWDGTIDGKPAENGNYIMVVIATTYNGAVIELNGPVTLIK
ncbi:MAG: PKD-like domain-containing protein, partial [Flavobacteriaceae bacterium]